MPVPNSFSSSVSITKIFDFVPEAEMSAKSNPDFVIFLFLRLFILKPRNFKYSQTFSLM